MTTPTLAPQLTSRSTALHTVHAWGTVITLEVALEGMQPTGQSLSPDDGQELTQIAWAMQSCLTEIERIDAIFSTYRLDSRVSALRYGIVQENELTQHADDRLLAEVLRECRTLHQLTRGSFDPWAARGGYDPSGYVKGWAAGRLAQILWQQRPACACGVCVNAGGDVSVRGSQADGRPWSIGIRHPLHATQMVKIVHARCGHVATSGRYERGNHIINPYGRDGHTSSGPLSATVWGPDDGAADALATALLIDGRQAASWLEELCTRGYRPAQPQQASSALSATAQHGESRQERQYQDPGTRTCAWGAYVVEAEGAWRIGETDALA